MGSVCREVMTVLWAWGWWGWVSMEKACRKYDSEDPVTSICTPLPCWQLTVALFPFLVQQFKVWKAGIDFSPCSSFCDRRNAENSVLGLCGLIANSELPPCRLWAWGSRLVEHKARAAPAEEAAQSCWFTFAQLIWIHRRERGLWNSMSMSNESIPFKCFINAWIMSRATN